MNASITEECRKLVREVRECLQEEALHRVLLFGSWARGRQTDDSDVDLLVVLDRETPFSDFSEKSAIVIRLRRKLQAIAVRQGLDLAVLTISEWQEFLRKESWSAKEIQRDALEVA